MNRLSLQTKSQLLRRLQALEKSAKTKHKEPLILCVEDWVASDDTSDSFQTYVSCIERKNSEKHIVIDNLVLESDIYLDTGLILIHDKPTIQHFIDLAASNSDIEYMKAYISLFHDWMGIDELEPKEEMVKSLGFFGDQTIFKNGRWYTREECIEEFYQDAINSHNMHLEIVRDILKEYPFYLDFFNHYKLLTVEEMVERYKDKRFFKMISNQLETKTATTPMKSTL